jgi:FkbM family methyltransferase
MKLAQKHPKLWEYRIIASYLGRMKTFVLSQCKSDFIKLDGISFSLPENEILHLTLFEHEGLETKIVKKIVKEGENALVLGANIGYWTCLLAKIVGESGKVFTFEPSPTNFEYLKKNVEANGYKNVILEPKAVADKSFHTKLYLSEGGSMDNRIYDSHMYKTTVDVDVVKIDDYFQNSELQFDFIKMNIQGADFAAIEGMDLLLKKSPNAKLIVEFAPEMSKGFGTDPNKFIDNMVEKDYNFYELWWYEKKIKPISIEKLKFFVEKNINTNLICIKKNSDTKLSFI